MKKILLISSVITIFGLMLLTSVQRTYAAFGVVQAQNGGVVTAVSSSLMTLTTTSTAGDLLVVVEGQATAGPPTNLAPTDSASDTYSLATSSFDGGTHEVSLYYMANAPAVATATCNWNTSITSGICGIYEVSGAATTSPLDVAAGGFNTGTVSAASTSLYTTTNANDILILGLRVGANQTTWTPASGWALPANSTTTRSAMPYEIVSSTQSATTTVITYGTATANVTVFGAFKAASGAATTTSITVQRRKIITMNW